MKEAICFLSTLPSMGEWKHSCCDVENCQYLLPPQGFRRGGTLVTRAYIKESTYSWNIQSVCQKKSRLAWTGAARNPYVMMFLLFAPASTEWLGWRKDRKSLGNRLGRFCDIYCAVIFRYSLVPRRSLLTRFPREVWERAGERTPSQYCQNTPDFNFQV